MVKRDFPGVNVVRKRLADGSIRRHYYHRKTKRKLPDIADPGFPAAYAEAEAFAASMRPGQADVAPGTWRDLIARYKGSAEHRATAATTRRYYSKFMDMIGARWGPLPVRDLERMHVVAYRDKIAADAPGMANGLVDVLSLLINWGIDRGFRKDNPASRIKRIRTGPGHRPWSDGELEAFRERWPLESTERAAFELLLNTGQRGSDVIAMVRQQRARGRITVIQQKTGGRVEIPESQALTELLDVLLAGHDHLIMLPTKAGRQFAASAFRVMMREAYRAAGLPDSVTTHGLRHTAGTILYELGCDPGTIADILGHSGEQMTRRYIRQRRQSADAIARLDKARPRTK